MHFGSKTHWLSICVLAAVVAGLTGSPCLAAKKLPKPQKEAAREDDTSEAAGAEKDPTTFAEAMERGKIAYEQMVGAAEGMGMAAEQPQEAERLRKEKVTFEAVAYRLFRLALVLADKAPAKDRPAINDINEARLSLSVLNYHRGNYYDAAVIGEYLAHHAPESPEGRQGAVIALGSYGKLFTDSKLPDPEKTFEIEHVQQIAEYIMRQWPNDDEALRASQTLLNFAINQHQLDKAVGLLKQIPEKSARRADAEFRVGQALWTTCLKAPLAPAAERPTPEQLERYKTEAQTILNAAVERQRKAGELDPTTMAVTVGAMLSLAQIYVAQNENEKAVAALEDPQFGPLTMIKAKDPSVGREGFAVATYKLAVGAYIATQDVKTAMKIMNSLEKRVGNANDPKAADNLTQIYIGLGHELQLLLERLRKSGNKKELDAVSSAFETFLKRIVERGGGGSFNSSSWVAETFYGLATNFDDNSAEVPEKAKGYYTSAVKGYEQILARAAQDPKFVPDPDKLIGIRLRMAISERRLGHYNTAIKLMAAVLESHPKMITAQVEAAETYQMSGAIDSRGYLDAVAGGEKTPKGDNLIWGWGVLAKMTMDDKRFEDTFYKARLKIAECRYLFALKTADKAKHDKYIGMAKKELSMIYRLRPNLGGPESYGKYDSLAKLVQTELGEPAIGIQEFKDADAKSAQVEK